MYKDQLPFVNLNIKRCKYGAPWLLKADSHCVYQAGVWWSIIEDPTLVTLCGRWNWVSGVLWFLCWSWMGVGWGGGIGEGRGNSIYIKLTVQKNEFAHQSNLLIDCQWCVPEYTTKLHYSSEALTGKTVQFAWAFEMWSTTTMPHAFLISQRWESLIFIRVKQLHMTLNFL